MPLPRFDSAVIHAHHVKLPLDNNACPFSPYRFLGYIEPKQKLAFFVPFVPVDRQERIIFFTYLTRETTTNGR
jgi:hypothetical protein